MESRVGFAYVSYEFLLVSVVSLLILGPFILLRLGTSSEIRFLFVMASA